MIDDRLDVYIYFCGGPKSHNIYDVHANILKVHAYDQLITPREGDTGWTNSVAKRVPVANWRRRVERHRGLCDLYDQLRKQRYGNQISEAAAPPHLLPQVHIRCVVDQEDNNAQYIL